MWRSYISRNEYTLRAEVALCCYTHILLINIARSPQRTYIMCNLICHHIGCSLDLSVWEIHWASLHRSINAYKTYAFCFLFFFLLNVYSSPLLILKIWLLVLFLFNFSSPYYIRKNRLFDTNTFFFSWYFCFNLPLFLP